MCDANSLRQRSRTTAKIGPRVRRSCLKPDLYIEEARRLRLRLNGLYNLYNTSG